MKSTEEKISLQPEKMTEDFDEEQKLVTAEQCLEDDLIYS